VSEQVFPVYVINLDRRPDRLARMRARLDAIGVAWERIPALDAQSATDADLAPEIALQDTWWPVRRGAQCLARTNVAIFRRILDEGHPGAVVLQDDVEVSPDLARLVRDGAWAPDRFGLIQMEFWPGKVDTKLLGPGAPTSLPGRHVHRLHSKSLGAACFFLRDWGARAFLEHGLPVRASGDHSLFNPACAAAFDAMETALLQPALALQAQAEDKSDISPGFEGPNVPKAARPARKRLLPSRDKLRKEVVNARPVLRQAWLTLTGRARWRKVWPELDAIKEP